MGRQWFLNFATGRACRCLIAAAIVFSGLALSTTAAAVDHPSLHTLTTSPNTATALPAPPCSGTAGNFLIGRYVKGRIFYEGVQGNFVVHTGTPCAGHSQSFNPGTQDPGNFVFDWSMIASAGSGATDGWSQSGFFRNGGGNILHFSQFYNPGTNYLHDTSVCCAQPGETHTYWQQTVEDSSGAYALRSNFDSTIIQISPFDEFDYWDSPEIPEYANETAYSNSLVPGSAAAPVQVSGLTVQNVSDQFTAMPCTLGMQNDEPTQWADPLTKCPTTDFFDARN